MVLLDKISLLRHFHENSIRTVFSSSRIGFPLLEISFLIQLYNIVSVIKSCLFNCLKYFSLALFCQRYKGKSICHFPQEFLQDFGVSFGSVRFLLFIFFNTSCIVLFASQISLNCSVCLPTNLLISV